MKKMFNKILTGAMLLGMGLLGINDASAQNFHMNGASATYNATCSAVIRLASTTSQIQTTTNPFGTNEANQIEGIVDWAAAGAQTVQALHYEKLVISGTGNKAVPTGVYVYGITDATCTPILPAYSETDTYPFSIAIGGPNVSFAGTFNYAGSTTGENQNIFPTNTASGGPDYDDLALIGDGTKTVQSTDEVNISGSLTSSATTPLIVAGDLFLGADASTLDGTLTLNDNGATLNMGVGDLTLNGNANITAGTIFSETGDGDVTVGTTSTLALAGDNSILDFEDNTNLIITGAITNGGTGINLVFACLSTVTYNGAAGQDVLPTISTNSYGNLVLSNGGKDAGSAAYGNDFYVCNDFTLNGGGNFNLYAAIPAGGVLYMTAEDAVVTYGANEEVVGKMNRVIGETPTAPYVFNNAQTILTLATDTDNPTSIELAVRPSTNPYNFDGTKDVNRKVNMTYSGNGPGDFEWQARVGYLIAEGPSGGTWPGLYTQGSVRFYESDNVAADDEKVGTGNPYSRNAAAGANLGYVQLAGIGNTSTTAIPNGIGVFASTNDLKLTAGPTTFYTVNDGRWTNPGTWDEGARPTASDDTEIRHMVYVGINGPFAGTIGEPGDADTEQEDLNTLSENAAYPGGISAARSIEIASGYTNASLIIGNEDNGLNYKFATEVNDATSFVNNNTNAHVAAFPSALAKTGYAKASFNGLWLMYGNSNWNMANVPQFSTYNVLNLGAINNEGVIEVGQ